VATRRERQPWLRAHELPATERGERLAI